MSFIKTWFSDSNAASSKRIAGTLGFVIYLILLINGCSHSSLPDLLYCSVALLGLGTVDRIAAGRSGNNNYYPYQNSSQ